MTDLTLTYSTHRPETLELSASIMQGYDTIILEEPPHQEFAEVLRGNITISDHLLELDLEYPEFSLEQYGLVRDLYKAGRKILQIEPYLEQLLHIQYFLAEDRNSPDDIAPGTISHAVYSAEKNATARLIDYYKAVKDDHYDTILTTMDGFARADAARFVLRDKMRAEQILASLNRGENTYIEAGSIHLLLCKLIRRGRPADMTFSYRSIDRDIQQMLGLGGKLFSPGDTLTLHYVFGKKVKKEQWQKFCAQSLLYAKIISKEEMQNRDGHYPHTRNEVEAITLVSQLSLSCCRDLYYRIRNLPAEQAAEETRSYCRQRNLQVRK